MATYLLFAGECYYPRGGVHDFMGRIEAASVEDARAQGLALFQTAEPRPDYWEEGDEDRYPRIDWYHLAYPATFVVVERGTTIGCGGWGEAVRGLKAHTLD